MVVGAGPAGLAFALSATQSGLRVAVLERGPRARHAVGEVIASRIQVALAELGLWDTFCGQGYLKSAGTRVIWSGPEIVDQTSMFDAYGGAWFVDRNGFSALLQRKARKAGVTILEAPRIEIERSGLSWQATIEGCTPRRVSAPWLIDATGRDGGVAARQRRMSNDRLVGLVAYARRPAWQDDRFLIEASANGWWYAAPLPGDRQVIAYLTDASLIPSERQRRSDAWLDALARTTLIRECADHPLGIAPADLIVCPAGGYIRETLSGEGWLAIGDAAACYDPLCGRGVDMAIAKGMAAARLLSGLSDFNRARTAYCQAERETFEVYESQRRSTYALAGRKSTFWFR